MKSLEMLNSEEGQLNGVFACFGSAAQHGQLFETALRDFLLAYNRLLKKSFRPADVEGVETSLYKKTMGALLTDFRKHVKINDDAISTYLSHALLKRNFLIHSYFRERQDKFGTEQGRMEMLAELVAIEDVMRKATDVTNGMRIALCEALESGERKKPDDSEVLFSIEVDILDDDR